MEKHALIKIGTSGYHYKHWLNTFYPSGTKMEGQLAYYCLVFDTVEINNSFYKLPAIHTVKDWKESVPGNFLFAAKASRYITHVKRLHVTKAAISQFIKRVAYLGEHLGPILFQLPPRWKCNLERLKAFLGRLPEGYRYVFEFRDPDWYRPEVYDLLSSYNCAFCIYQLAGHQSPKEITADFIYIRLHGPGQNKYQGSYTDGQLNEWAKQCLAWQKQHKDIYIYFDNDQKGYAALNAQRLIGLLS
jgi:uncharacterized protein YecE (DUF72 family)